MSICSRNNGLFAAVVLVGTFTCLGLTGDAAGADFYWVGTPDTVRSWHDASNWSSVPSLPGRLPGPGDSARIDNYGDAEISGPVTVDSVLVGETGNGYGTLRVSGGSLALASGHMGVGSSPATANARGRLIQTGGAIVLNTGNFYVGAGSGGYGNYYITGGSLRLDGSNVIGVGGNRNTRPESGLSEFHISGGTVYVRGSLANVAQAVFNMGHDVPGNTGWTRSSLHGDATLAVTNVRFGNRADAASRNEFSLFGLARLLTESISIFPGHIGENIFNFNGGTLTAERIAIPLDSRFGGTLAPADVDFAAGAAAGAIDLSQLPVNPIDTTVFTGNNSYAQGRQARLAIDVAAAGLHDRVDIGAGANTGDADIAGTVAVNLLGGYDPPLGATFDVLTADTIDLVGPITVTGATPAGHEFKHSVVMGDDGRQVLRLTVSRVPEPGAPALVCASAVALALARRRRRRKLSGQRDADETTGAGVMHGR